MQMEADRPDLTQLLKEAQAGQNDHSYDYDQGWGEFMVVVVLSRLSLS